MRSHAQKFFEKIKRNHSPSAFSSLDSNLDNAEPALNAQVQEQLSASISSENKESIDSNSDEQSAIIFDVMFRNNEDFSKSMLKMLKEREGIAKSVNSNERDVNKQLQDFDINLYNILKKHFSKSVGEQQTTIDREIASWVLNALENHPSVISIQFKNSILRIFPNIRSCNIIPYNRLEQQELEVSALEERFREVDLGDLFYL